MRTTILTLDRRLVHPSRDPRYITSREIERRIGCAAGVVSANFPQGRYPFRRVMKARGVSYFDRAEVEEWLDAGARDKLGNYRITPKAKS